jgi:pimeloyl-ACP methyl ester carboxylesterase
MMRLQADGTYPRTFSAVKSPVLMLHGDYDPHPGAMIRDSLKPLISQLEYQELKQCGHNPWLERHARNKFFSTMKDWLTLKMAMRS